MVIAVAGNNKHRQQEFIPICGTILDQLAAMRVFVAVAEQASFAAAARRLGLSAPAATRAVAALERHLGSQLLLRSTRRVRPTETGVHYLADARRILAALAEADAAAAGAQTVPRGRLTVTAPVLFGRLHVAPALLSFLDAFPEIALRVLFLDRVVDLLEEGVDVAVRIGEMRDGTLSARKVGTVGRIVCAAPAYLARHGPPLVPAHLTGHRIIAASSVEAETEWRFTGPTRAVRIRLEPHLVMNAPEPAIDAARAGWGIVRVPSYQVAAALRDGRLVRLLAAYEPPEVPVSLVHRDGPRAGATIRALLDHLAPRLRRALAAGMSGPEP
jgi:DNA-binding transcriptional LysR family regulator